MHSATYIYQYYTGPTQYMNTLPNTTHIQFQSQYPTMHHTCPNTIYNARNVYAQNKWGRYSLNQRLDTCMGTGNTHGKRENNERGVSVEREKKRSREKDLERKGSRERKRD